MNTRFKVFASYNILQYLCNSIQVLIFVTVSKCWKGPDLTNIVIKAKNSKMQNGDMCDNKVISDGFFLSNAILQ
jgi:hypothetical protein